MIKIIIEILKWFFVFISLIAAFEGTKPNGNYLKMNVMFTTVNIFTVLYFISTMEWAYVFRNIILLFVWV